MKRLMKDREERVRLGKRAMDITKRFGVERVLGMWEALLKELVGSKRESLARQQKHSA